MKMKTKESTHLHQMVLSTNLVSYQLNLLLPPIWSDASYAVRNDSKGQTGVMVTFENGAILRYFQKQKWNTIISSKSELVRESKLASQQESQSFKQNSKDLSYKQTNYINVHNIIAG